MTPPTPLGLYIHWPYCTRICPYCDFNVYRPRDEGGALFEAMRADLAAWREITGRRELVSLHFGGGTPSLMSADQIGRLIEDAARLFGLAPDAEIGLEANPNESGRFADFAAAGVNRFSVGVQSFDDDALAFLGRDHDAKGAREALDRAMAAAPRVSADLIYALEGRGPAHWRSDLETALASGVGHLSAYQLTIEPGAAFSRREARGERLAANDEAGADLFEMTQSLAAGAGLAAYEISNHARTRADQSRHNRLYWDGGDWIGIGPGAHSRIGSARAGGRLMSEAVRRPGEYAAAVAETGTGSPESVRLSAGDEAAERILMGLRVSDGLDRDALMAATGLDVDTSALSRLADEGWVSLAGRRVALAPKARLFADRISGELVPDS